MKSDYVNPIQRGDMVQCRGAGEQRYGFLMFVSDDEHAIAVRRMINQATLAGVMALQYRVMRAGKPVYPK